MMNYILTNQYSCTASRFYSVCMVADIDGKTEGLYWTEKCLTWEAYIDTMWAEKVLQFKLPSADSARILTGKAQDFTPTHPTKPRCHTQPHKE